MSRGRIIAAVVVLAIIGAVVAGVLYSNAAGAPSVTTAKAKTQTLGVLVTASGKMEAASRYDVYPPTAGTLDSVEVTDGAHVDAGDTLAQMDTEPLELQVRQAASAVEQAEAQLESIDRGVPVGIDKKAACAAVSAAKAAYDAALSAYRAFQSAYSAAPPLVKPSMVATLTALNVQQKNAYASYLAAKSNQHKVATGGQVVEARDAAEEAESAAEYSLKVAKDTLDKATLTAPAAGTVVFNAVGTPGTDNGLPKAAAGAAVTPASSLFTIVQLGSLNFNAQVDEADVDKVRPGMKSQVSLDAFPSTNFEGTVTTVRTTAIQTTTGGIAFPVLISVQPAGKNLLIGMSGSTNIEVNAVEGALTVPIQSVLDANGAKYVFVVQSGGTVKKTKVQLGALTDTQAQVLSGLGVGDTVVTSNLSGLTDGETVRTQ